MRKASHKKEYKRIKKACEIVGFEVECPKRYKLKEIYVIDGKTLELHFGSVIVRKAKYSKSNIPSVGISGEYSGAYPTDCYKGEFVCENGKGVEYWNGSAKRPKAYLAVWNDNKHTYSYSVYAPRGIKLKSMSNWQKLFK